MSKPFARIINVYSRFIGFSLTFILPAVIIVGLALSTFNPVNFVDATFTNWVNLVWVGFVLNSFILAFNAILVTLSFDAEVNKLTKEGTPINSAAGFRNLERKYKASNFYLFIISFFALLSWAIFTLSIWGVENVAKFLNLSDSATDSFSMISLYLSVSSMIFTIAAAIAIRIPSISGLKVGTMVKYYVASRHPYVLESLFSDSIYTLLDPITRVYFIKWCEKISDNLEFDFAPAIQPPVKRQRIAVQNILVLLYLHFRLPNVMDMDTLRDELLRIVPENKVDYIMEGEQLNIERWIDIFEHLTKETKEVFLIVDRIVLTLRETPEIIDSKDFWITSAVPPIQKKDETQDIVFLLFNLKKGDTDPQKITMRFNGADELSPHDFEIDFELIPYDDFVTIPKETDELLTEQKRLFVKLVTGILYQGTGIWISVHSENIGTNLIAIDFSTADAPIETQIFNLRVVKDIKFYLQSWGPKILASLGIFLPILRALLGL